MAKKTKAATAAKSTATRARARSSTPPADDGGLVWLAPSALRAWSRNPRAIDDHTVERIAQSIMRFGFGAPVVARAANREIIAGHVRQLAALKLKLARVPVRLLDVSEADAHELALRDNRDTELTPWDTAKLAELLGELSAEQRVFAGWTDFDYRRIAKQIEDATPPRDFESYAEGEKQCVTCPQCGFAIVAS